MCRRMADPPAATPARSARAPFRAVVLACGKCSRKLDGGFGRRGREPVRKALKRALKTGAWGRKVRVAETACLGLCPRRRQVLASPAGLAAGRLLVVEAGAEPAAMLDALLPRAQG